MHIGYKKLPFKSNIREEGAKSRVNIFGSSIYLSASGEGVQSFCTKKLPTESNKGPVIIL
jgi:hypothetical protein